LQLAIAFHVYLGAVVYQNIRDFRICEQGFQWAEAEGLVLDFHDEPVFFNLVQGYAFLNDEAFYNVANLAKQLITAYQVDF